MKSIKPIYTTIPIPDEINLPWSTISQMDDETFAKWCLEFRQVGRDLWEQTTTPIMASNKTEEQIISKLKGFHNADINDEKVYFNLDGKRVLKGYSNLALAVNHWFPEIMSTETTRGASNRVTESPIGVFYYDDEKFIHFMTMLVKNDRMKIMKKKPDKQFMPAMASVFKIGNGIQAVTNIRGMVAKWIYTFGMSLSKADEIVVYDPSMGWGGRLIAFLSASSNEKFKDRKCIYLGVDPNSILHDRYAAIVAYWKKYIDPTCTAEVYHEAVGSEDFHKTNMYKKYAGKISMAYTSPPYFNRERYSSEETQSFRKYSNYDLWRDGFLTDTMQNVYNALGKNGLFFFNIANIKITKTRSHPLESDAHKIADNMGFKEKEKLYMLMRSMAGRDQTIEKMVAEGRFPALEINNKFQKYEPVFIFQK